MWQILFVLKTKTANPVMTSNVIGPFNAEADAEYYTRLLRDKYDPTYWWLNCTVIRIS